MKDQQEKDAKELAEIIVDCIRGGTGLKAGQSYLDKYHKPVDQRFEKWKELMEPYAGTEAHKDILFERAEAIFQDTPQQVRNLETKITCLKLDLATERTKNSKLNFGSAPKTTGTVFNDWLKALAKSNPVESFLEAKKLGLLRKEIIKPTGTQ